MASLRVQPRSELIPDELDLPRLCLPNVDVFESPPPSEPLQTADEPASGDGSPGYPVDGAGKQ